MIFICKEKIKPEYDLPIYTYRFQCQEDQTEYLDDDTWTVLVNADCSLDGVSKEMAEFLEYIKTGKAKGKNDSLAKRIESVVSEAKRSGKWSAEYMRWEDELNHRYYLGHEDGLAEGIKQEKVNTEKERNRADEAEIRANEAEIRANEAEKQLAAYIKKFGQI